MKLALNKHFEAFAFLQDTINCTLNDYKTQR